jgi:hypothetical protein
VGTPLAKQWRANVIGVLDGDTVTNGIVGIEIVNRTAGYQVLVDATKASAPVPA